jgi:diacylglycerol kinase (ATP)
MRYSTPIHLASQPAYTEGPEAKTVWSFCDQHPESRPNNPRPAFGLTKRDRQFLLPLLCFSRSLSVQQPNVPSSDSRHVLILVNPKAGRRSSQARVDRLAALLSQRQLRPEVFTDLCDMTQQANSMYAEGRLRAVVGVGGDGTAAELVNRTVPGVPLALLPAGNENLLARHLGFNDSPEELAGTIADGQILRLDAAQASGRIFLIMFSCGFDAAIVRRLHDGRTGHASTWNYAKPILDTVRTYDYPEFQVSLEEHLAGQGAATGQVERSLRFRWLFVFNLPCYGGGLPICRQASGSDGLLDLCGFSRGSTWQTARYLAAAYLGLHQRMADWTTCRTRRLRIDSAAEVPYQLDGDPGGTLPVEVEVLPGRLTVLAPKN